ncbi:hypothetical protein D1872_88620 [compost metagenome]
MKDKPRNWQEDMKLSEQAKGWTYEITFNGEGNIVAEDANYTFAQVIAEDIGISNAEIILDGLEALSYWLQEAEKWRIEAFRKYPTPDAYEAACAALEKHRARADRAESLIQQKDAEIAELKRLAEFWESQYSDATTHGDETEERLNEEIARLTALLQDVGDTP